MKKNAHNVCLWVIVVAWLLCPGSAVASSSSPYTKLRIFAKVLSLVEMYHVNGTDGETLIDGAIQGMIRELDPYSAYLTRRQFKILQEDTEGAFFGVGLEVSYKDGVLEVIAPIKSSPAERAGIRHGDIIVEIEGQPTAKMDIEAAVQAMRGVEGTAVNLKILRKGHAKPLTFELVRAPIQMDPVSTKELDVGMLYVGVKTFSAGVSSRICRELKHYIRTHVSLDGVILDLRGNPGGLMNEAIKVSDLFLSQGTIVATLGRQHRLLDTVVATKTGWHTTVPVVVLIDGGSASASEIVAGALKDNDRAILVGTPSFGKGSIQTVISLHDGSGLKLTTALYATPSGNVIHKTGIAPHVVVESTVVERDAPHRNVSVTDEPIAKALDILKRQTRAGAPR